MLFLRLNLLKLRNIIVMAIKGKLTKLKFAIAPTKHIPIIIPTIKNNINFKLISPKCFAII